MHDFIYYERNLTQSKHSEQVEPVKEILETEKQKKSASIESKIDNNSSFVIDNSSQVTNLTEI